MNQRERTLAGAMGAVVVIALVARVVYPKWIAPMFDYDRVISQLEADLDDLVFDISQLDDARDQYREYVYRTGGTDAKVVGDQVTSTLHDLLRQCRLQDVRVNPKAGSTDRKTGLVTLSYSIRAKGPLQQAVLFLKSFYELPYMASFNSLKLVPKRSRRRGRRSDTVVLNGSIDVLVPPTFFAPIPENVVLDKQPTRLVKYRTDVFASIWEKDPFNRPEKKVVKRDPVGACCVDHECVETNTKAECSALGGEWFPNQRCPEHQCPQARPAAPQWEGDPDRSQKVVRYPNASTHEVMVVNTASKQREYIRVGEQLDGGELLMVHPYGVLVRRTLGTENQEYLYPLGELLADAVALEEAAGRPQLRAVAYHFLAEVEPLLEVDEDDGSATESGELAGPPARLAGPLVESEITIAYPRPAPGSGFGDASMTIEIAGPPEELAGTAPPGDGAAAQDAPSTITPDRVEMSRSAERKPGGPNRKGP